MMDEAGRDRFWSKCSLAEEGGCFGLRSTVSAGMFGKDNRIKVVFQDKVLKSHL